MSALEALHNTSDPLSECVHACLGADLPSGRGEAHVCQMMACEIVFSPKRKNQRFCSEECRHAYFALARRAGTTLIEKISQVNAGRENKQSLAFLASLKFSPDPAIEIKDLPEEIGA